MSKRKPIMPFIWVRLGDTDDYNRFDDVAEAAEYMALFGVKQVHRSQKYGVDAKGFTGNNYISLFFGDGEAQPTGELSNRDIHILNSELGKHPFLMQRQ
jgi:hypothetical protein